MARFEGRQDGWGLVGAAVVHNKDFVLEIASVKMPDKRIHCLGENPLLVVRRHYDRESLHKYHACTRRTASSIPRNGSVDARISIEIHPSYPLSASAAPNAGWSKPESEKPASCGSLTWKCRSEEH